MEPIILSIDKEADVIHNLSIRLTNNEHSDYTKRSHMAHNIMNFFDSDLTSKSKFLHSFKKKAFVSEKAKVRLL